VLNGTSRYPRGVGGMQIILLTSHFVKVYSLTSSDIYPMYTFSLPKSKSRFAKFIMASFLSGVLCNNSVLEYISCENVGQYICVLQTINPS